MKKFIVIGGGILGASTAFHLAKAGEEVLLVDRQDAGQGTDAAAGIICPWLSQRRNKAWYSLAKSGASYYSSLIQQLEEVGEAETGYKRVGAVSLHMDEGKLAKMEERARKRREDAPEVGEICQISKTATSDLFPPVGPDYSSVYISGAARVNGRELRNALIRAAKKNGALVREGSAQLLLDGDRIVGIRIRDEEIFADTIIITAGAWASELLEPIGIHLQVKGQKAQIIHLQLEDVETSDWPVVMPPNDQYILAFEGGRIVMGATHEDDKEFDLRVTAGGLAEILHKALSVAPGLNDGEFAEARVGYRPFTPGFLPIIGEVPGVEGLFLANGLGASGLTVGPFLGWQMAKLVTEGSGSLDIDLDLYDVSQAIIS
ncbi:FAD-binding oxidoreductase [Sporosarcina sp. 179-K 3D1 HS]|uniref:NAD(P)/FAD-dependent oxidoreductase n=1 Tax=Sporosarcina sp. 179-K 3D1 HS TaxID=3232169 RepID=UPI0039A2AE5F